MKRAIRLEAITIVWMGIEAGVSIGAGVVARSVLLLAFGTDSMIELISALVLLHRLRTEVDASAGSEERVEALERRTSRIAGYLLYALALYVVLQSLYGLLHRQAAERSMVGIAVAVAAAVGMPLLAKAKIRVAEEIGSRALRADAMEAITCGYLSWVLLAGLAANALLHWWWLDSVAALALVPFLLKEGREAITGQCGCGSSGIHK
jgi:divalent metal cation (Fe/Co/Zn/Cd) transporter